ncbi:hypothetical protein X560_2532 [Listeria fleischmannii 1991]|uniref:Inner membrane protein yhaI n=2 Tax=Listeria fleischmannii TaxID=1069827 RepID=A0A2X3GTY8_9LIST|nr:DUF805 domain-containing protein [Listeria fleischmannii]EMG27322.1 hypothetical protein LFLEISCH_11855 [Listeria fleischmannii subsp. fleischmannii LU2006-1]KMT57834.1 hypothetical protein X560_2532 [Listeria fleischmannii 1991]SQC71788.1 Inner membrane protein yhaI [Listeria fleischmannii subsp. fleischmannii]
MGFLEAYKSFWRNYVNFSGRSSRSEYWYVFLWNIIIVAVFYILMLIVGLSSVTAAMSTSSPEEVFAAMFAGPMLFIMLLFWLYGLANIIPALSLSIRRLHDSGKSGWFILLGLIPFVGSIIVIVFMCLPSVEDGGKKGDEYGF